MMVPTRRVVGGEVEKWVGHKCSSVVMGREGHENEG